MKDTPKPHTQDTTEQPKQSEGGGGGHASEPEKTAPPRKEPENRSESIPFIPKGALIHTKNRYPKPAVQKTPSYATSRTKQGLPSGKRGRTQYPEAQASEGSNPPRTILTFRISGRAQ